MKFLVVGLGNPGEEYQHTRHNIGFDVLDALAAGQGAEWVLARHGWVAKITTKGRTIILLKPNTYMNLSGKAVKFWMQELKVPIENILVIVDDLAIPFSKLRMRAKGSSAGHNGLKSIEEQLGTQNYARLKYGIDDDFSKGQQVNYVLSPFNKKEFEELPFGMDKAINMIISFCSIGIAQTMTQYND